MYDDKLTLRADKLLAQGLLQKYSKVYVLLVLLKITNKWSTISNLRTKDVPQDSSYRYNKFRSDK